MKKYEGMWIFLIELLSIFFTILGTIIIALIKQNPAPIDLLLIVLGYLVFFYFLFVYSWWNVELDNSYIKFYNNWKILGCNNYVVRLSEIQSIEFCYYNWTGTILKTRPIIKVQFNQKEISIIGPSLTEIESIHVELKKTTLKIYSDYSPT